MDKNSVIGFGLLIVMLIAYIFYNQRAEMAFQKQRIADSIALAKNMPAKSSQISTIDTTIKNNPDLQADSLPEQIVTLENEEMTVRFSNKGATPNNITLKKFKTYDGKPLTMFLDKSFFFDWYFKRTDGSNLHTRDIVFAISENNTQQVTFQHPDILVTYKLPKNGFMMDIDLQPLTADFSMPMTLNWQATSIYTEQNHQTEKQYSQVGYYIKEDGYDYFSISEKKEKKWDKAVNWLSFKQHYFNTTIIAQNNINGASVTAQPIPSNDTALHALNALNASLTLNNASHIHLKYLASPNDYRMLKNYGMHLEELIPLSYGIFGFVKYINTWIVIPIFNGLSSVFKNYGIVILLLTFIIRLLMSPFTYKSYVSSAKMKALKPELDALREKHGEDKQTFGMEQMKLYREAGVNPLGGCLPALLQLPVFFALLSFFPHAIELRQSGFLWAKDLSTYDSILNLPFNIPFYGNHVSLFTLLFVITSILLALYSMNSMADQSNPAMKYLPFIMPVMFLGIFNSLPAALTFYYFVSNVITLLLQFVIQNWIIDPQKIRAQIEAKRNEPPKENKFMKRMQEMQQAQQERLKQQQRKK